MTCLLSIDSSTERMCIALSRGTDTFVFEGEGGAQASARLLPEVLSLLQRAGCTLRQVDAIGFGREFELSDLGIDGALLLRGFGFRE